VDALQLTQVSEKPVAGEIFLSCIDKDVTNSGFEIELVKHISDIVSIPVIASSGAGKAGHFSEVIEKTDVEAALGAGIFHREEVPIEAVVEHMRERDAIVINYSDSGNISCLLRRPFPVTWERAFFVCIYSQNEN